MTKQQTLDPFAVYWAMMLNTCNGLLCVEPIGVATKHTVEEPLGFDELRHILGTDCIARLPVRSLFGISAHVYAAGFFPDGEGRDAYASLPPNQLAHQIMFNACGFHGDLRGRVVILAEPAIYQRDLAEHMVKANADTIPEIERDWDRDIGPGALAEWKRLVTAVDENLVPSLQDTRPTLDRVAWLLRMLLVGIDTDIETHAGMHELLVRQPHLVDVVKGLWEIQQHFFNGSLEVFEPSSEDVVYRPTEPKWMPGFSDRWKRTIH